MESVIIVTSHAYTLEKLRHRVSQNYDIWDAAPDQIVIQRQGHRIYIALDPRVLEELEPAERMAIAATIPDPVFYVVDFSDIGLCRELLLAVADEPDVLVDNNHGKIMLGSDFARTLKARPDWDWRRDGA